MLIVAGACALSAIGLWNSAWWGHRLALVVLTVSMVGDATNALARHELRTLVGLPVASAVIAYLLSPEGAGAVCEGKSCCRTPMTRLAAR